MITPQKFRELAFQLLFCFDARGEIREEVVAVVREQVCVSLEDTLLAMERAKSVYSHREDLDKTIAAASTSYDIVRIQKVELNVLRLAIFELLYDVDVPNKVAIAEGIRLCRKFSTPESSSYVNALLDGILKDHETSH